MRIVVVSDTHRDFWSFREIVEKHKREAECFIHLGDGMQELMDIRELYPDVRIYSVRGNCDFGSRDKETEILNTEQAKIFFTHGHHYHVKYGLYDLKEAARQNGAQIALYGHTHEAKAEYDDGLYILNPGSPSHPRAGKGSYGIIDLTQAGIVLNIVEINP